MNTIQKLTTVICVLVAAILFPIVMTNVIAAEQTLKAVTINDDGMITEKLTGADTVADTLRESGISIQGFDLTNYGLATHIYDGMNIIIAREVPITIIIHDRERETSERAFRAGTTVYQVLTLLQDEMNLALIHRGEMTHNIMPHEVIEFYTFKSRIASYIELIPYEVYENTTGRVRLGRSHVRQSGIMGEYETLINVVYIGGIEMNREIISTGLIKEPVTEIIDIGRGILGTLTDPWAEDFHYVRRVRMEATAYTAGYGCTGKHPCDPWYRITASGIEVEHGIVAVDRTVIPLGTMLYVDGYGFALAADVGGAIRGYMIDLFMECWYDAIQFGRRHIYVWILE